MIEAWMKNAVVTFIFIKLITRARINSLNKNYPSINSSIYFLASLEVTYVSGFVFPNNATR